jgi:molybdenum cofactor cytidylyltransferase
MKAQTIDVKESMGRTLSSAILRSGGKKLLAKGHLISKEDTHMLETEGMAQIWVTELEEGEVSEYDAVVQVATEIGCGALEIRPVAGGRANLFTTEPSCILVDGELLRQINGTTSIAIATCVNFSYAPSGQRVATVKSTPFAVAKRELDAMISIVKERGPVLQARPIRTPLLAILYTDPLSGERARRLFESVMRQRLARMGVTPSFVLCSVEEEGAVARSLEHLLRAKPTAILVASTTAPAGPDDVIGRSMVQAGCQIERFLAPVEPGNLFLLGYRDDVPIVSVPGCFQSAKPNVLDLMLSPMLARYRISYWEVAALGHGGLLV